MVLKQLGTFVAVLTICAAPGFGLDKVADRLEAATSVVGQILDMPDGIPQELTERLLAFRTTLNDAYVDKLPVKSQTRIYCVHVDTIDWIQSAGV